MAAGCGFISQYARSGRKFKICEWRPALHCRSEADVSGVVRTNAQKNVICAGGSNLNPKTAFGANQTPSNFPLLRNVACQAHVLQLATLSVRSLLIPHKATSSGAKS